MQYIYIKKENKKRETRNIYKPHQQTTDTEQLGVCLIVRQKACFSNWVLFDFIPVFLNW